jgi:hypothetical protein
MKWSELWQVSTRSRGEQLVLDACLDALERTRSLALHASVAAELPTVQRLCYALDAHGIPVPREAEVRVATLYQLAP